MIAFHHHSSSRTPLVPWLGVGNARRPERSFSRTRSRSRRSGLKPSRVGWLLECGLNGPERVEEGWQLRGGGCQQHSDID
jgi:hypothetical protein